MRKTRALTLATAAFAALLPLVTAPAASAITGGSPDGTLHPYVGMLFAPGSTTPHCTVTLIRADDGETVGLTDAHCVYNGRRIRTGYTVTFVPDLTATSPKYAVTAYVDPSYAPWLSILHDVAVLRFRTAPPIVGATLAPVGTVSAARYPKVTTVGIGSPYRGHRRYATELTTRNDASWLYLKPGTGNSCSGDSGGPDLAPGTSTVLALTDQGTCSYDQDTRVDSTEVHGLPAAAKAWATRPTPISIALSPSTIRAGSTITISGRTSGVFLGESVLWQRYSGGWQTWTSTTVQSDGSYRFTGTSTVTGTRYYRVVLPATTAHPAGVSATVALKVTS